MYTFEKISIDSLNEYEFEAGDFHYIYKTYDFLYKYQKKKKLVIFFHGAGKKAEETIFRGYDYNFENADILSLSDNLLKKYFKNDLLLSWFLSTSEIDNTIIYKTIIEKIIKKYEKTIFTGTSGGGYPSLYFSSIFKGICLISNSQIYLDKYPYFSNMLKILKTLRENIDYNIEEIFLKYGSPDKIYLYTNILDTHHYEKHSLPFKQFMEKNYKNHIEYIFFKGDIPKKGYTNHHIQFPDNQNIFEILNNILSY